MPPEKSASELRVFRQRLLRWYREHRRDLPWRGTKDPYRIWISEVMLQQTRAAAALPYYQRFLTRFPSVHALARAREAEVLKFWAGLGYYSRARLLHRAAKEIVARHGGRFPRELESARSLPGVGPYTAAAVLSIACRVPLAVLDGNVARVLARLGAVRGNLREARRWRKLGARAEELLEKRAPGDWNQAMMELGATICTPRAPLCRECPVSKGCRAFALGIADSLPEKRKKRDAVSLRIAAAVLLDPAGRTLLIRESDGNTAEIFSRMWQFPAVEVIRDAAAELRRALKRHPGLAVARLIPLPGARHAVTYRRVKLLPFLVEVARLPDDSGRTKMSVSLRKVEGIPASSATRKIARAALQSASAG